MTTLGYFFIILGWVSFAISSFRRVEWLMIVHGIICLFGVMFATMQWYAAHYVPSPGIIVKFSGDLGTRLQVEFLLTSLIWTTPLIGYGVGTWLRQKVATARTPRRVDSSF